MMKSAGMFEIQVTVDDAVNNVTRDSSASPLGPFGRSMANPTLAEAYSHPRSQPQTGVFLGERGGLFGIWPRQGKARQGQG